MTKKIFKKPRIIFIDLIRILAIFLVILHHLRFHFINLKLFSENELWSNDFIGLSLGDIGVSLFIFISGISLTYSLSTKPFKILNFYKKRLKRIYPDFLTIYLFFFTWYSFKHLLPTKIALSNLLLSLTGIDTYLVSFFNFVNYSFFDWFIGFILVLYLIFPFLYYIYKKNQYLLIFVSTTLLLITSTIVKDPMIFRYITLRVLEFSLGMCYAKMAIDSDKLNHLYILTFSLLGLFAFQNLFTPFFLIIRYILLDYIFIEISFFLSQIIQKSRLITKTIIYMASLTYMIFLLQHQTLLRVMGDVFLPHKRLAYPKFISPLLFQSLIIIFVIFIVAVVLTKFQKIIFVAYKKMILIITKNGS